jgi:Lon protease-like protein
MDRIAVFPIPNMVVFPGHDVHLHVFEPRYRKMVRDCIDNQVELGVVLPKRRISKTTKKSLNANQDSFEPNLTLCCGVVKLVETLDDGRLLISINAKRKVRICELVQKVPYYVGVVEEVEDRVDDPSEADKLFVQLEYYSKLLLAENYNDFEVTLPTFIMRERALNPLVAEVLKWFIFRADLRQQILEYRVVENKAVAVIGLMREFLDELGFSEDEARMQVDEEAPNVIHVDFSTPRPPVKQ